jgi:hypothetical protein
VSVREDRVRAFRRPSGALFILLRVPPSRTVGLFSGRASGAIGRITVWELRSGKPQHS